MPWGKPMNEQSGVAFFQILSTRWPSPRYRAQPCSAREPPVPSGPLSLPQTTLPHASQVFPTQLPPSLTSLLGKDRSQSPSTCLPECSLANTTPACGSQMFECRDRNGMAGSTTANFPERWTGSNPHPCPDPVQISWLFGEWFQKWK